MDEDSLAAAPAAVQSHAVEVSPSPATTAGTQSPASRLPSPARPAQLQVLSSPGPEHDPQSGSMTAPRIGRELAANAALADAPAEQAVAVQAYTDGAGQNDAPGPDLETSEGHAVERSGDVSQGSGGQEPAAAQPGEVTADAPGEHRTLTEAGDVEAASLQASGRQTAHKGGVKDHAPETEAGLASERETSQIKAAPPAFWKSMSGLFAAPGARASSQPLAQESPSNVEEPTDSAAGALPGTSTSALGEASTSALLHPQRLRKDEPTRQPEPRKAPVRPQAPDPSCLAVTSAPSGEPAPELEAAAAHAGSLSAAPEAPPADTSGSCVAVLTLSEAEEVRSPERMGANRPPIMVTSPFAVAALQAQCGLDPRTANAIEAAVMSPKKSLTTQAAQGRGLQPMSAASALEGLQAQLAKGDLPGPGSPAPEDLCFLGRPPAKSPSLGAPPTSQTFLRIDTSAAAWSMCIQLFLYRADFGMACTP